MRQITGENRMNNDKIEYPYQAESFRRTTQIGPYISSSAIEYNATNKNRNDIPVVKRTM